MQRVNQTHHAREKNCLLRKALTLWDKYMLEMSSLIYLQYQRLLLAMNCRGTVQMPAGFHKPTEGRQRHHEHPLDSWIHFELSPGLLHKTSVNFHRQNISTRTQIYTLNKGAWSWGGNWGKDYGKCLICTIAFCWKQATETYISMIFLHSCSNRKSLCSVMVLLLRTGFLLFPS